MKDKLRKINLPAPFSIKCLTISKWPSKQAARNGVELVFVELLTLAPNLINNLTIPKCPAAAAHHNGGAPSIVSPSKFTVHILYKKYFYINYSLFNI